MKKGKRHINIPIFIPHLGCPNMCVFCNQRLISGQSKFDKESVHTQIEEALSTISADVDTEIAFFGGSFTGIDRELMVYLLDTAEEYVRSGRVSGIRLSTRPDYINTEILDILKKYTVKTIELGIQSMDDCVLEASRRGHTSGMSQEACKLVLQYGFELIGQMMVGLPGADTDSECQTAREICAMGASGARVYPTVVFKGTELFDMTECGVYSPLDTDEAVMRTKNVLAVFAEHRLPVIRVGLCASENLASDDAVAGATHSAIGELAMGELYYDIICRELNGLNVNGGRTVIAVPRGEISKAVGQKRKNTLRLRDVYRTSVSFREDDELDMYQIKIISYIPEGRADNCI